jgi:hypothetical protein
MAKVLPVKPARWWPNNAVQCIRVRLNAAPDPTLGERGLAAGKYSIGTIPRGAMLMPGYANIETAFTAGATIDIGDDTTPARFVPSATIAPGTAGLGKALAPLVGAVTADTPLYMTIGGTAATAGVGDILIKFYTAKD